jgi:wyosine [tRNA(Phe)-imidazoG37] synthetase (radical SAM superfamily)
MSTNKRLICTKPFEWFEATDHHSTYPVYLCCSGWLNEIVGDLRSMSPLEIWRSEAAARVRKSVLDGSFKYCKKEFCPHLSSITEPVRYVDEMEYQEYVDKIDNVTYWPITVNCSYDKSCNLTCPSCRPNLIMAKGPERHEKDIIGDKIVADLGDKVEVLYITGSGDPFASKHFLRMLTGGQLKKHGLKLHLHTNAQLFTRETWNNISLAEKKIDVLEVSIDGASSTTYEVNRKPAKWNILMENMAFLSQLKNEGLIRHFKISCVIQSNNFHEMSDFVTLGKGWGVDLVYFSTLNNWGTFTREQYLNRAVHKKNHPLHEALLHELKKIDRSDRAIELGFFNTLL